MRAPWALVVGCLALAACRTPTQISVTVRTDVPCGEVTSTAFTSGKLFAIEGNPPTTESTKCGDEHLGTVVLLPSDEDNAEVGFKIVTALHGATIDHCSGAAAANDTSCIVARRDLRFLPHTMLDVIVDMSKQCEGRICDASSTCVNGVCKSATIADPSQCTGAGCDESVLGGAGPADAGVDATIADAGGDATIADGAPDGATIPDATADEGVGADAAADSGPLAAVPGCDLTGLLAGAAWPMEQYCPSGRNRAPLAGPPSASAPRHLWTYDGGIMRAPSVGADGTVYVADNAAIVALDPVTGSPRWRYAPDSGPAFANLPVLAADGTLHVLDYNNATYVRLALDASAGPPVSVDYSSRGAVTVVGDGTMYFPSTQGQLVALNGNGSAKWATDAGSYDELFPSVGSDGTIFTNDSLVGIFAWHPNGGSLWSVAIDSGTVSDVSVAVDGTLRLFSTSGRLYAMNPSNGAVLWSQLVDPSGLNGIAVADDGTTYASATQSLTSWSPGGARTGTAADGCDLPTIDANGDVYAICDNGNLTMFDAALHRQWQIAIPSYLGIAFEGIVVGTGNRVFTTTTDNVAAGAIDAYGP